MKIIIAPDSFKESMTAVAATEAIEKGIKKVLPNPTITKFPMADGGEGTVEALVNSMDGSLITHSITGPLGEQMEAQYGIINDHTAVIEIAAAVGLQLVPPNKRNPLKTTTYGIGELIIHALNKGIRHFIIGLGGSSTNDGGIGMAQALGAEVTDERGDPVHFGGQGLSEVNHISIDKLDQRLKQCTFDIACDVENPLTGQNGAAYIYGPQKGANEKMIANLDHSMQNYANILKRDLHVDVNHVKGAGAAGGLGAAFIAFLHGTLKSGIDIITTITGIESHIKTADLVITGEGKIDDQTIFGKTPVGVAKIAQKYDVPVIAITGANELTSPAIYEAGIKAIFSITNKPMTLEEAMECSEALTEQLVENIIRFIIANEGISSR